MTGNSWNTQQPLQYKSRSDSEEGYAVNTQDAVVGLQHPLALEEELDQMSQSDLENAFVSEDERVLTAMVQATQNSESLRAVVQGAVAAYVARCG